MNNVILTGRLTRDPELSYTQSQMAICRFTLAVDRPKRRDKRDGEPSADFIRITVFDKQAETCNNYLTKGRQIAVNGRIQTGSYKNNDGQTVYTTDVVANNIEFLGSKGDNSRSETASEPRGDNGHQGYKPVQDTPKQPMEGQWDLPDSFTAAEDDIPFN